MSLGCACAHVRLICNRFAAYSRASLNAKPMSRVCQCRDHADIWAFALFLISSSFRSDTWVSLNDSVSSGEDTAQVLKYLHQNIISFSRKMSSLCSTRCFSLCRGVRPNLITLSEDSLFSSHPCPDEHLCASIVCFIWPKVYGPLTILLRRTCWPFVAVMKEV